MSFTCGQGIVGLGVQAVHGSLGCPCSACARKEVEKIASAESPGSQHLAQGCYHSAEELCGFSSRWTEFWKPSALWPTAKRILVTDDSQVFRPELSQRTVDLPPLPLITRYVVCGAPSLALGWVRLHFMSSPGLRRVQKDDLRMRPHSRDSMLQNSKMTHRFLHLVFWLRPFRFNSN